MEESFALVTDDDNTPIKKIGAEGIVPAKDSWCLTYCLILTNHTIDHHMSLSKNCVQAEITILAIDSICQSQLPM
jgi:hypothetical protein